MQYGRKYVVLSPKVKNRYNMLAFGTWAFGVLCSLWIGREQAVLYSALCGARGATAVCARGGGVGVWCAPNAGRARAAVVLSGRRSICGREW